MTTSDLVTLMVASLGLLTGSGGFLTYLATRNQANAQRLRDAERVRRTLEDYCNELRAQIAASGDIPKEWPEYE